MVTLEKLDPFKLVLSFSSSVSLPRLVLPLLSSFLVPPYIHYEYALQNDLDTSYKNMPASVRERDFDRSGKVSFGRLSGDEDTRVVQMTNPQQKSMAALMDRWNVRKVPDREMMEWEKVGINSVILC